MLNITDKAVSKWERNVACPDTMTLPKLADILGVSIEELMNAKTTPIVGHKGAEYLFNIILRVLPVTMGIAVAVTSLTDNLNLKWGFIMLGLGLISTGICLLKRKD